MRRFAGRDAGNKPTGFTRYVLFTILVSASLGIYTYINKANLLIIDLRTISGPILNPLMGWAPWATIKESQQPHNLVYADLTWRDFEPQEGSYDFKTFEEKQQLDRWRREGKHFVFRFVADVPGSEMHRDIPDWLFEKIGGSGDAYDTEYGKGFSPDYSNPIFIEQHGKAIRALGERYGKDGFFAFVELGSLGHWGEWHIHPGIASLPSEDIKETYVHQYLEAFPGTHLLMRRPFSIAQKLGLGLYNDMTGDLAATNTWLEWIKYGGADLPEEAGILSPMPEGWQTAPVGGEQTSALSNEQVYRVDLEQTLYLLRASHASFIGPGGPYDVEYGGPLQNGLDQVMATIGYRIYLAQVRMPRRVVSGKDMEIRLTFSNNGIAPMYYNWPTRLYLLDRNGSTISSHETKIDLKSILPAQFYDVAIQMPLGNLEKGTYSIGIAIIDPMTGQPAVRFANENTRQDLIQYVGSFEVRNLFDWLHF